MLIILHEDARNSTARAYRLKLEKAAERLNLSPQELLVISVEEKLTQLDEEFRGATVEVLRKNADLYKRLA